MFQVKNKGIRKARKEIIDMTKTLAGDFLRDAKALSDKIHEILMENEHMDNINEINEYLNKIKLVDSCYARKLKDAENKCEQFGLSYGDYEKYRLGVFIQTYDISVYGGFMNMCKILKYIHDPQYFAEKIYLKKIS